MKSQLTDTFTQAGLKRLISQILDLEALSEFELAKRTGIHPTTIYYILHGEGQPPKNIRRSTVRKIGEALGYHVTINSEESTVRYSRAQVSDRPRNEIEDFARELAGVLYEAGRQLSQEEKAKVKEVVRVLIAK